MKWKEIDHKLMTTFVFKDFLRAMKFMHDLIPVIEEMNHHPTWTNTYNKVEVFLQTHDAGNMVTEKDRELAAVMDEVYQSYS